MTARKSHANSQPSVETHPNSLPGYRVRLGADKPLNLDCGLELSDFTVAYQTYGELNADKSNAILVCHALTGV